jgi:CRP-like cAMP-binding protein
MKWLRYLETYNISFNIHILNKEDSILIDNNNRIIYIIEGFIQTLQVFTNKEILCTQLLYKNQILGEFPFKKNNFHRTDNHYYKFIALTRTLILTTNKKELITKGEKSNLLVDYLSYYNYIYSREIITIMSHKTTKKRLIQFLFILIERLGTFIDNKFLIPLNLSHYTIATVIGSQRITVNKIMNELKKKKILFYDNQKISITKIIQLIY